MDEGRLKEVRRCQNLHRKYAYALNDTIRNRQNVYEHYLTREEHESEKGLMSKVNGMRNAVIRSKVLMQCLRVQKQQPLDRMHSEPTLGRYGGRPIASYSRDVDQRLAWYHPTLRRLRKVDRVRQSCLRHGGILDEDTVKERMQDFFDRNLPAPSPELCPSPTNGKARRPGTNIAEDFDDFDLRDFHDPLSGAAIELKLHPFGNAADINTGAASSRKKSPTKRDAFAYRNALLNKELVEIEKGGDHIKNHGSLVTDINEYTTKAATHSPAQVNSSHKNTSSNVVTKSLSALKYSKPLPSISVTLPAKEKHGTSATTEGTIKVKENAIGEPSVSPVKLRMSHDKQIRKDPRIINVNEVKDHADEAQEDRPTLTRRKTLILPPIETTKEMVKNN